MNRLQSKVSGYSLSLTGSVPAGSIDGVDGVVSGKSRFLIHPMNFWRKLWDVLVLLTIYVQIFTIPFLISFEVPNAVFDTDSVTFWTVEEVGTCAIALTDIVVNFFTGQYGSDGVLHMDYGYVFVRYFSTWFPLDIFSSFPWFLFEVGISGSVFRPIRLLRIFRIARLTKAIKLKNIVKKLEVFIQQDLLWVLYSIFRYCMYLIVGVHVFACCLWAMSKTDGSTHWTDLSPDNVSTLFEQYIVSLYYACTTAMTVGYGDFHANNHNERIFQCFALLACGISYAVMSAMMAGLIISYDKTTQKFTIQMKSAVKYMVANKVDSKTQSKVRDYLENILESKLMNKTKDDLYSLLSPQLQVEVTMSIYGARLKKFPFLRKIPEDTLGKVTARFKPLYLAPGDVLFREGTLADQLFFVTRGSVVESGPLGCLQRNGDMLKEGVDGNELPGNGLGSGSATGASQGGILSRLKPGEVIKLLRSPSRTRLQGISGGHGHAPIGGKIYISADGMKGTRCISGKSAWNFLGETALFIDDFWKTTAECSSFCEVLVLTRQDFVEEMENAEETLDAYRIHSAFVAAAEGQVEALKTLYIENKIDPDVTDIDGSGLMHIALRYDQIDCAYLLAERDIATDYRDPRSGRLPIHLALERNLLDLALVLIRRTSDLVLSTMHDSNGETFASVLARKLTLEEKAQFAFGLAASGRTATLMQLISLDRSLLDFDKDDSDLITTAIKYDHAETVLEMISTLAVCSHKHAFRLAFKHKSGQVLRSLTVSSAEFREIVVLPVDGPDDFMVNLVKKARSLKLEGLADELGHHIHPRSSASSTPKMNSPASILKRKRSFEDLAPVFDPLPVKVADAGAEHRRGHAPEAGLICSQIVYGCVIDALDAINSASRGHQN